MRVHNDTQQAMGKVGDTDVTENLTKLMEMKIHTARKEEKWR